MRWKQLYLYNRRTKVRLNGLHSRKVLLLHGVPQGGVVVVYINDLMKGLPAEVKVALYADDLVIWWTNRHISTVWYIMQKAVDMLISLTEKSTYNNKLRQNLFIVVLSPRDVVSNLYLRNSLKKEGKYPTYLGVTFHRKLTWKNHIENTLGRPRR